MSPTATQQIETMGSPALSHSVLISRRSWMSMSSGSVKMSIECCRLVASGAAGPFLFFFLPLLFLLPYEISSVTVTDLPMILRPLRQPACPDQMEEPSKCVICCAMI